MNNLILLVKSMFLNSFRGEAKKRKGQVSNFVGILISNGIFALLFTVMAVTMGPIFYAQGLAAEFLTIIFLASQIIILIFGTVVLVNIMFFSKDAEFLLYLPIKPAAIFTAKLIYVYLTELLLSAFTVAVTGTAFGIVCGFSFAYYPLLLIALFIVPMVPLIIMALLSVPIMYVISFFKSRQVLSTLMLAAVFGTLMYFYMNFVGGIGNYVEGDITLPVTQIKQALGYMLPNISLARIVTLSSANYLTDILTVLAFTAGLFTIAALISTVTFRRGMASQLEETRSAAKGEIKFEQNSVLKSLILKDFKEIIRSPGLAFYCLFQVFMAPVFISFYGTMGARMGEEMPIAISSGMGYFITVLMVIGINYTAMSSISREGANFNMLKTQPVPYSTQIRAKLMLANMVTTLGIIISFLAFVFLMRADIIQSILFSGFGIIMGSAFNSLLIYMDAKSPKLDWESIAAALKNSKAAFVSMGLSMAVGIPLFAGTIIIASFVPQNLQLPLYAAFWALFYAAAIIMHIAFKRMLENNAERLITIQEN